MFPVSIWRAGLSLPCLLLEEKTELPQWVVWLFAMLFSSVFIREAVLIHSGNLMKSGPFSRTPLLRAHPKTGETKSEDRQWVDHWSISTESFLPDVSFFVFHSDFWLPLLTVETCKSQEFSSKSCGLDWDQEGSNDYNSPHPQAACGIRKFVNIPHPYFGVMEYDKQQLDLWVS